jgi:hypothetical protein
LLCAGKNASVTDIRSVRSDLFGLARRVRIVA